jgi:hypothetical protein
LEVSKGVLNNHKAKDQCLLFVRNNICSKNSIAKMKEIGYFNEDQNDDQDLEQLKISVKFKLPKANTFDLNV